MMVDVALFLALTTGPANLDQRQLAQQQQQLSRDLATAAHGAEATADAATLRQAVTASAQGVIGQSGLRPRNVRASLETVLNVCRAEEVEPNLRVRTPQAVARERRLEMARGYTCPDQAQSYAALRDLLSVVARLATQDIAPGAGDAGAGASAFGPPPTNPGGGGGADYRTSPN